MNLYLFFHLNLAFSSIEEEDRSLVIDSCYWPLLTLIEDQNLKTGIEMSGYTLEVISRLSPEWVTRLKTLIQTGKTELIGSGYAQLIGPLVPARVNEWNQ